ncbi:hypothetical protein RBB77_23310 (plasmid) [Tunturibacter psychrotolerans]|uniref:Uncharacterized protein n=1 Tax=Tunturiibacter psychrotolerans TaxID=3069686 RepID=A0AAU7ZX87_9BACT
MTVIEKIQQNAALRFGIFGGCLFFIVQIALARLAPSFKNHELYSFFVLSLIGLVCGCAGWAAGIVLSPIGSQAAGAQKVLAGLALLWTGVVIGHLQQISGALIEWQKGQIDGSIKIELLFGLGLFLLALCVTFNTRFDDAPKSI